MPDKPISGFDPLVSPLQLTDIFPVVRAGANYYGTGQDVLDGLAPSIRALFSETVTGLSYDNSTGVLSLTSGYVIPTTTEESNWNTAYSWGNHASAGYATAANSMTFTNKSGNISQWTNDANYITISAVTDAVVTGKVLTGLSVSGGSINSSDTILAAFGKLQNQINGVLGGAIYQGVWNANTNSPALASGVGTKGYYYVVSVAGTTNIDGITDWKVGDWIIFNGTTWDKVDNTDAVSSVNGAVGAISLAGTADRITVSGTTWDIASTYVGQTSITTLGTITTGTWNGSKIGLSYIADVAANTFLANVTGSPATVQEISTGRIPLFSSAITGTPSASTFLRGDGSWQTVSVSPGGSNTQVQYNNSGSFAGSADLTFNDTTDVLTLGGSNAFMNVSQTASIAVGYKIGSQWVLRRDTNLSNLFIGNQNAHASLSTANNLLGVGSNVLNAVTTGSYNFALGFDAGNSITTGNYNVNIGTSVSTASGAVSQTVAIGYQVISRGANQVLIGSEVNYYGSATGGRNIGIGWYVYRDVGSLASADGAGTGSFYGDENIGIGTGAFRYSTGAGAQNIGIGYNALSSVNGYGGYNIALGANALGAGEIRGSYHIAIGRDTLNAQINQGNNGNVAIGFEALKPTTGGGSVAIGHQAGRTNSSGGLTVVGYQASYTNLTGLYNTSFGAFSGYSNSTGDGNTSLGYRSGYATTGSYNTYVGHYAGNSVTAGSYNVLIGHNAGSTLVADSYKFILSSDSKDLITGDFSTYQVNLPQSTSVLNVGTANSLNTGIKINASWALRSDYSSYNLVVGNNSSFTSATSPSYNVFIGKNVGTTLTGGYTNIGIGHASGGTTLGALTSGYQNIAIGSPAGAGITTGTNNFSMGGFSHASLGAGSDNYAIGYYSQNLYTRYGSVSIGTYAMEKLVGNDSSDDNNVMIGYHSGRYITNGTHVLIGGNTARDADGATSTGIVAVGYAAGYGLRTATYVVAIGHQAMSYYQGQGTNTGTVAIGYYAGQGLKDNTGGIVIGYEAAYKTLGAAADGQITGNYGIVIGYYAMRDAITSGADSIAIGRESMRNAGTLAAGSLTGAYNIAIGYKSLHTASGTAQNNVGIGANTLTPITTGANYNTAIGADAGLALTTGASNVFLGYKAGYAETTASNLLIIANSTTQELVRGDFSAARFGIQDILNLKTRSSDPTSPQDGDIWYYENGATYEFRGRVNGVTKAFTLV